MVISGPRLDPVLLASRDGAQLREGQGTAAQKFPTLTVLSDWREGDPGDEFGVVL